MIGSIIYMLEQWARFLAALNLESGVKLMAAF